MSDVFKAEELLFKEYDQQYEQYRHLDNLRERYIAFYIAFVTAVFVVFLKDSLPDNQKNLILVFLFVIGIFVLIIAISIRITQRLTADHLMEIRIALLRMLSNNTKKWVCSSYLNSTYKPHKKDPCIQSGWNWTESAIWLIGLLIFVNSVIGTYSIKIAWDWTTSLLSWVFVILIFIQVLFFIWRFKSTFREEAQTKRKNEMCKFLKTICEFPDNECKNSD